MKNDHDHEMKKLIEALYRAYDHFNRDLFSSLLPDVHITIGVKRGVEAIYSPDQFNPITEKDGEITHRTLDEILLNPVEFSKDERHVLSLLCHEMAHHYENHYGRPGRNGYHNQSWGNTMKNIGLYPSSTGEPGGKETGIKVSHYVIPDGPFEDAFNDFMSENDLSLAWYTKPPQIKKSSRKVTYRCDCDNKPVYCSTPGRKITCQDCGQPFSEDV